MKQRGVKIAIAMGTYKRPKMLREAILSLKELKVSDSFSVKFILADNDTELSAKPLFDELSKELPFDSEYTAVSDSGVVPVRNRLIKICLDKELDYLAFIDDDEIADPQWLITLHEAIHEYKADAVAGLVKYQLPEDCEDWIKERDFYGLKYFKTGAKPFSASTNNVIISLAFIEKHNLHFDYRLNECGSSDTHFFTQLKRNGGKLVWTNEAVTYETVTDSRASEEWILQRAFKTGYTTHVRNEIRFGKLGALIASALHIPFFLLIWFFLSLKNGFVKKSSKVFNKRAYHKARGAWHAILGRSFNAYHVIHGN